MDSFVTDTQALAAFARNKPALLGRAALAAFEAFDAGRAAIYVPAPVLVELANLARSGKLPVSTTPGAFLRQLADTGLVLLALEPEDVLAAAELAWDHRDPFDRLIVATALRLGLPLLTNDRAIAAWGGVDAIW